MFQTIRLDNSNSIWTLSIQREKALNALNSQVIEELNQALSQIFEKPFSEAKVLIITGAGEKAFVAGADIAELSKLTPEQALEFAEKGQKLFRKIENLQIPVIAAVNGFALGGGCELALACDFIYASESAKFGLPEVTLGLIPGFGGTVRLSRVVGLSRAREITFSGEMLNAQRAFEMGLVNKIVPQSELIAEANKIAATIASRGPLAVQHAKRAILKSYDQDVDAGLVTEAKEFSRLFQTTDVREGTTAFLEKRKPQFLGK